MGDPSADIDDLDPGGETPVALERASWRGIEDRIDRDPRLLMAISPLEDHGAALPIGTGLAVASAVVDRASARTGILRAPALPYGVSHRRGTRRPGVAPLSRKTLHRAVNELLAGWEEFGIREFVLVTAHGSESHLDALLMALTSEAKTTVFDLGSVPVRDVLEDDAGTVERFEAAILAHLDPDALRAADPGERYAREPSDGEALLSRYVEALLTHLRGTGPGRNE